ncbi:DMT family transporter [Thermococcus sp.]|uniref:DMT family transporter n=1 Tax=Thermococcus sp. TaxID=35749 RepID=UPI0025F23B59|nr:DMT family transporter [Thermococcus sp.]
MNGAILGILAALVSAFSWATSTILIKLGMRNKSAMAANIFRLYVVSVMYIMIFLATGTFFRVLSLSPELVGIASISGILGFVIGDSFYFHALKMMGVSRTVPITSTYPLWTILWAFLFLGRRISPRIVIGAVLIVLAIVIVRRAEERERVDPKGFIFAMLAPLSWSLAILAMDWLTRSMSVLTLVGLRMMFAALGVSIFLPGYSAELRKITGKEALFLTGAAVSGLLLGQYLFVYSVGTVGSQIAAPVSSINPVISSLLAVNLLGEPPNRRIMEGLVLAVLGVVLIST